MKTIKKVNIEPKYIEQFPETKDMLFGVVYISEKYWTSAHLCLCGCGQKTIMPFHRELFSQHWKLIKETPDGSIISFDGSVGNYNFDCRSHYVITKNVAKFC